MLLGFSCSTTAGCSSIAAALAATFQVYSTLLWVFLICCLFDNSFRTVAFYSLRGRARLGTDSASIDDALPNDKARENGGCKQQYQVEWDDYTVESTGQHLISDGAAEQKYQCQEDVLDTC
jgi:hypothetical protein